MTQRGRLEETETRLVQGFGVSEVVYVTDLLLWRCLFGLKLIGMFVNGLSYFAIP